MSEKSAEYSTHSCSSSNRTNPKGLSSQRRTIRKRPDPALFRRFDDVIEYSLPGAEVAIGIMHARLATFDTSAVDWETVAGAASGMSQADVARAADEAAKTAILERKPQIDLDTLLSAIAERKSSHR